MVRFCTKVEQAQCGGALSIPELQISPPELIPGYPQLPAGLNLPLLQPHRADQAQETQVHPSSQLS